MQLLAQISRFLQYYMVCVAYNTENGENDVHKNSMSFLEISEYNYSSKHFVFPVMLLLPPVV